MMRDSNGRIFCILLLPVMSIQMPPLTVCHCHRSSSEKEPGGGGDVLGLDDASLLPMPPEAPSSTVTEAGDDSTLLKAPVTAALPDNSCHFSSVPKKVVSFYLPSPRRSLGASKDRCPPRRSVSLNEGSSRPLRSALRSSSSPLRQISGSIPWFIPDRDGALQAVAAALIAEYSNRQQEPAEPASMPSQTESLPEPPVQESALVPETSDNVTGLTSPQHQVFDDSSQPACEESEEVNASDATVCSIRGSEEALMYQTELKPLIGASNQENPMNSPTHMHGQMRPFPSASHPFQETSPVAEREPEILPFVSSSENSLSDEPTHADMSSVRGVNGPQWGGGISDPQSAAQAQMMMKQELLLLKLQQLQQSSSSSASASIATGPRPSPVTQPSGQPAQFPSGQPAQFPSGQPAQCLDKEWLPASSLLQQHALALDRSPVSPLVQQALADILLLRSLVAQRSMTGTSSHLLMTGTPHDRYLLTPPHDRYLLTVIGGLPISSC